MPNRPDFNVTISQPGEIIPKVSFYLVKRTGELIVSIDQVSYLFLTRADFEGWLKQIENMFNAFQIDQL